MINKLVLCLLIMASCGRNQQDSPFPLKMKIENLEVLTFDSSYTNFECNNQRLQFNVTIYNFTNDSVFINGANNGVPCRFSTQTTDIKLNIDSGDIDKIAKFIHLPVDLAIDSKPGNIMILPGQKINLILILLAHVIEGNIDQVIQHTRPLLESNLKITFQPGFLLDSAAELVLEIPATYKIKCFANDSLLKCMKTIKGSVAK